MAVEYDVVRLDPTTEPAAGDVPVYDPARRLFAPGQVEGGSSGLAVTDNGDGTSDLSCSGSGSVTIPNITPDGKLNKALLPDQSDEYLPATVLPASLASAHDLLVADTDQSAGGTPAFGWMTTHEAVARALGWVIVTDTRYGTAGIGEDDTGAVQAACNAATPGTTVWFPPGSYRINSPITIGGGITLRGAGARQGTGSTGGTVIRSAHAGAVFTSPTPGTRIYGWGASGFSLNGPGKTATGSIGIDLDSVSTSHLSDLLISGYDKGISVHSAINGGAVYNRCTNVTAISCNTGVDVAAAGCNAFVFTAGRLNNCTVGLKITDSNNCTVSTSQIEANTTGVQVNATAAAKADANTVLNCRFEANATSWDVTSSNVRDFTVINPAIFDTYVFNDNGTRTTHFGTGRSFTQLFTSQWSAASGSWRFERSASGGTEIPAMVISDSVGTTGTPVTLQIQTERAGYFARATKGGVKYWEVTTGGQGRFVGGLGVGNSAAASTLGTVVKKVQIFDAAGTSLGYIPVYNTIT